MRKVIENNKSVLNLLFLTIFVVISQSGYRRVLWSHSKWKGDV